METKFILEQYGPHLVLLSVVDLMVALLLEFEHGGIMVNIGLLLKVFFVAFGFRASFVSVSLR